MTLENYLMVFGLIVGVALLYLYTSWEQRQELSKLRNAVKNQLEDSGWILEPAGKNLSETQFLSALPSEMKTGMLQDPCFYKQSGDAWVFANRKLMHRRVSVFGSRVAVVQKIPWILPCGIRVQEYINFGVLDGPSDSRFGFFDQVESDRSWWVCSMCDSAEADNLLLDILQIGIPHEIQCVQIVNGYMITSSRSVIAKSGSYSKAIEGSRLLYDNIAHLFEGPGNSQSTEPNTGYPDSPSLSQSDEKHKDHTNE